MVEYYQAMAPQTGFYQPGCDAQAEEEWDREQLLDPAWEIQQRKTFTAWCNSHLRKAGTGINELSEDFRNGLKLMLLLEVISGEPLPRPDRGRMRVHQILNVSKALDFIEAKGVKLVSIGAEEIVDGNVKITLGLIWTIILRFAIESVPGDDKGTISGLLRWCQRKTAGYPNVDVKNFSSSWKDGLAFCALIHKHRPDLLDFARLNKNDPMSNLNLAFDIAEKHLDIPKMLDAEDICNSLKPDEKSIMTYVSSLYHCFLGMHKSETAGSRICRVLRENQENEKLMDMYETMSSDLLSWIRRWMPWLSNRREDMSLDDSRKKMEEFRNYRRNEKPPKIEDKGSLETLFNTLQTRLRLSNRPAFMPIEGHLIGDINKAWDGLERSEKGFEEWLLSEIMRLERLEHLAEKFRRKCAMHEEWVHGKEAYLSSNDWRSARVYEIKAFRKKHEAFESDLGAHQERVEQIVAIARELNNLRYLKIDPINARCKVICEQWDRLGSLSEERKRRLEEVEKVTEQIDGHQLAFAKRAAPFNNWLDSTREDLADIVIVRSIAEVDELLSAQAKFKGTLSDADSEFKAILNIEGEVQRIIEGYGLDRSLIKNPYSDLAGGDISRKWNEVQQTVPQRDQKLQGEYKRQQANETLRQSFANKSNVMGGWIENQLETVISIGMGAHGSLENAIQQLKQMQASAAQKKPHILELESINEEMQKNYVFDCKDSRYTMDAIRVGWETLQTNFARTINEFENQILLRDKKSITDEQLNEIKGSFNHFCKDQAGLDVNDLKACLISVGYNLRTGAEGDQDMAHVLSFVDPNKTGRTTFEAFLAFMTRETTDNNNLDQMIESFSVLSRNNKYITAEAIRSEIPANDAEYCIYKMEQMRNPNDPPGQYNYIDFCRSLYLN
uniref:Actinin n=1 Tax=Rhabditophanes sp. KR3021 TaxID=114890 RepID=A0AC35UH81_9BILA